MQNRRDRSIIDFRVIRLGTGESFLCIQEQETDDKVVVIFPLVIKTHTIPIADNIMREIHSTTQFCPFSDDKEFIFSKKEISFNKPLGTQAVPYYIEMLNRHETEERLNDYDLAELIQQFDDDEEHTHDMEDLDDSFDADRIIH